MRSHPLLAIVYTVAATATAALAAQDLPHAGRWKMNPAKSDFGQTTATYEQAADGTVTSTMGLHSYTFKMDGRDYPAFFDLEVAWTERSPSSWQAVWKLKGKVLGTDTLTLSADGKTLTTVVKGTKPNGEPLDDTVVAERVSGGPGLGGKWRTKNLKSTSPSVVEIAASGSDGLVYRVVDMQLTCEAKFDGKDHPCTGPTIGSGWTVSVSRGGTGALDMTVKNSGKLVTQVSYTVSADGKTLTEHAAVPGTTEKSTVVYDRQ